MTDDIILANLTRQTFNAEERVAQLTANYRALLEGFQKYMEGGFGSAAVMIDVPNLTWQVFPTEVPPPPAVVPESPVPETVPA